MLLKDKVAVVTGGGRGIGEAITLSFSRHGAKVALLDKNLARAVDTAARIEGEAGNPVVPFQVDITDYAGVKKVMDDVAGHFGRVDLLVNNAGWDIMQPFLENSPEVISGIIDLNLKGHINCCHCAVPKMITSGGGKIVNISSDAGRIGAYGETVYAAAKGGLIAFTKSLAIELAGYGICVNSVAPGPTETPMLLKGMEISQLACEVLEERKRLTPFKRFARPGEIADAVLFFASPMADYVTGQVISVSGGLTMAG